MSLSAGTKEQSGRQPLYQEAATDGRESQLQFLVVREAITRADQSHTSSLADHCRWTLLMHADMRPRGRNRNRRKLRLLSTGGLLFANLFDRFFSVAGSTAPDCLLRNLRSNHPAQKWKTPAPSLRRPGPRIRLKPREACRFVFSGVQAIDLRNLGSCEDGHQTGICADRLGIFDGEQQVCNLNELAAKHSVPGTPHFKPRKE